MPAYCASKFAKEQLPAMVAVIAIEQLRPILASECVTGCSKRPPDIGYHADYIIISALKLIFPMEF
jgi:hypothetical protein